MRYSKGKTKGGIGDVGRDHGMRECKQYAKKIRLFNGLEHEDVAYIIHQGHVLQFSQGQGTLRGDRLFDFGPGNSSVASCSFSGSFLKSVGY